MKLKRALSLLLAALMLGGCLASCANDGDNGDDNVGNQTTEALSEEETQIRDNLPDNLNFEGEEINFYSFYEKGMTSGQVTVPELNGDPINDAVYERNKFVENRLNVKIVNARLTRLAERMEKQ